VHKARLGVKTNLGRAPSHFDSQQRLSAEKLAAATLEAETFL